MIVGHGNHFNVDN